MHKTTIEYFAAHDTNSDIMVVLTADDFPALNESNTSLVMSIGEHESRADAEEALFGLMSQIENYYAIHFVDEKNVSTMMLVDGKENLESFFGDNRENPEIITIIHNGFLIDAVRKFNKMNEIFQNFKEYYFRSGYESISINRSVTYALLAIQTVLSREAK